MPFDRHADRRRFVNAGSVGLGYGHTQERVGLYSTHKLVVRRARYDTDAAASFLLAASDLPGIADVAATSGVPKSDAPALDAFTQTVREQQSTR